MALIVRKPKLTDRSCWLSLWQGYLSFYQAEGMSLEMTELLWKRIHTNEHPIECLVVQVEGESKLAGFVHFLPHVDTWRKQPVCYLEDLFVAEEQRGLGVGKELIQAVVRAAQKQNWAHVYWKTKHDNVTARRLYDKLTGGTDGFVTYRL